jgi:hypothetical protein
LEYKAIRWVHLSPKATPAELESRIEAAQKESIERYYLNVHRLLFGPAAPGAESIKLNHAVLTVKNWFDQQKGRVLVVLDSADLIEKEKIPQFLPLLYPSLKRNHTLNPPNHLPKTKRTSYSPTLAKAKLSVSLSSVEKSPTKYSPINSPRLTITERKVLYRVDLSRRQNIPSLLKKVDREKPPPKNVLKKKKRRQRSKEMLVQILMPKVRAVVMTQVR